MSVFVAVTRRSIWKRFNVLASGNRFPAIFGVRLRELGRVFPGFPSVGRSKFIILVFVLGVADNAKAPFLSAGPVRGYVRHGARTQGELD